MDVTVEIRRGSARFADREPGRMTWHAFSFGAHYDPERVAFGPMVCHDEHLLRDGQGFDTHHHVGLEIITWVLSGALAHRDSTGTDTVLHPGAVAVFSTGPGVEHSEIAVAPQTRFVQVWLTADDATGSAATYAATPVDPVEGSFVAAAEPRSGASLRVARLAANDTVTLPAAHLRHLYVASGALLRSSLAEPLQAGDAFLLTSEDGPGPDVTVTAAVPTELLLWSFD